MPWKQDLLLWPRDQETEFTEEVCCLSQTQEGKTKQIHPQTFDDLFFWRHSHDLHAPGSHWTDSQQRILCWGFKGVQEEIPRKEASTGQWHFHQDNAPLHNSILVTDYLTKMGIKTVLYLLYCPNIAPCDFYLFPKLRGCRYETMRRWKRLWRRSLRRSHKRTSVWPSRSCWNGTTSALQPEEITSKGTRVSCVYYQ